jgi:hypothetical protein
MGVRPKTAGARVGVERVVRLRAHQQKVGTGTIPSTEYPTMVHEFLVAFTPHKAPYTTHCARGMPTTINPLSSSARGSTKANTARDSVENLPKMNPHISRQNLRHKRPSTSTQTDTSTCTQTHTQTTRVFYLHKHRRTPNSCAINGAAIERQEASPW